MQRPRHRPGENDRGPSALVDRIAAVSFVFGSGATQGATKSPALKPPGLPADSRDMGEQMARAQIPPELHDRDWLVERLDEGATTREIAVAAGTHRQLVERALRSHGLHYVFSGNVHERSAVPAVNRNRVFMIPTQYASDMDGIEITESDPNDPLAGMPLARTPATESPRGSSLCRIGLLHLHPRSPQLPDRTLAADPPHLDRW